MDTETHRSRLLGTLGLVFTRLKNKALRGALGLRYIVSHRSLSVSTDVGS